MRRSFAILIWILLGALAASLGIGSVLLNAREERNELTQKLQAEKAYTLRLQEEHTQLITEANQTVAAVVRNASATRELLDALTQEQTALEQAIPLLTSLQAKRWLQTIGFPLGISIRTPAFTSTTSGDAVLQSNVTLPGGASVSWLSITRYNATRSQDLTRTLTASEPVSYRLNQTLITGTRGISPEGETVFVLRTQRRGIPIHLIWAKTAGSITAERILDSLSTLLFATS